jgi:hypothetical protein
MTDQTVELEEVREEAMKIAEDLQARSALVGLEELARRVGQLANHVATVAHHSAGEIKNRRLTTDTP